MEIEGQSEQCKPRAKHNSVYLTCYFDGEVDPGTPSSNRWAVYTG